MGCVDCHQNVQGSVPSALVRSLIMQKALGAGENGQATGMKVHIQI